MQNPLCSCAYYILQLCFLTCVIVTLLETDNICLAIWERYHPIETSLADRKTQIILGCLRPVQKAPYSVSKYNFNEGKMLVVVNINFKYVSL
jgi:hypothetical protein